jgi:hypothetical protein
MAESATLRAVLRPVLVGIAEVASMLGRGVDTVRRDERNGRMPAAIR